MYEGKNDLDENMLTAGLPNFEASSASSETRLVNSNPSTPVRQSTPVSRKSDELSEYHHAENASNQSETEHQDDSKVVYSNFILCQRQADMKSVGIWTFRSSKFEELVSYISKQ